MELKYPQDYKPAHKLDSVDASNYKPEAGTEHLFHIKQEHIQNGRNGRTSVPAIQTYPAKMWSKAQKHLTQMGWTLIVLYDPTEYNATMAAAKADAATTKVVSASTFEKALKERDEKHAQELAELRKEMRAMREPKEPKDAKEPKTPKAPKEPKDAKTGEAAEKKDGKEE